MESDAKVNSSVTDRRTLIYYYRVINMTKLPLDIWLKKEGQNQKKELDGPDDRITVLHKTHCCYY